MLASSISKTREMHQQLIFYLPQILKFWRKSDPLSDFLKGVVLGVTLANWDILVNISSDSLEALWRITFSESTLGTLFFLASSDY